MTRDDNRNETLVPPADDSDADAFAVLSLLVIIAAAVVYYLEH